MARRYTPRRSGANILPRSDQEYIIAAIVNGVSINGAGRLARVAQMTAHNLARRVGESCALLHNARVRDLAPRAIEADECWTFVAKRRRSIVAGDGPDKGNQWIYVAIDPDTRLIVAFLIGKRTRENTHAFVRDIRARVTNTPDICTDGMTQYTEAIFDVFGMGVNYVQIFKENMDRDGAMLRKHVVSGDPSHASTGVIERSNLTLRSEMRRLTRGTQGFSKKLDALRAAMALHVVYYNFVRKHMAIGTTPAVAAGLAARRWTLADLLDETLSPAYRRPAPVIQIRRHTDPLRDGTTRGEDVGSAASVG